MMGRIASLLICAQTAYLAHPACAQAGQASRFWTENDYRSDPYIILSPLIPVCPVFCDCNATGKRWVHPLSLLIPACPVPTPVPTLKA